jgi:hypothetical protein
MTGLREEPSLRTETTTPRQTRLLDVQGHLDKMVSPAALRAVPSKAAPHLAVLGAEGQDVDVLLGGAREGQTMHVSGDEVDEGVGHSDKARVGVDDACATTENLLSCFAKHLSDAVATAFNSSPT